MSASVSVVGTQAYDELVAGQARQQRLLVDSAATAAVGQVLQWDASGNNFVDYTNGAAAICYAVCAEDLTLSADTRVLCLVSGSDVRKDKLDSTAQADDEIEAALLSSGIRPISGAV